MFYFIATANSDIQNGFYYTVGDLSSIRNFLLEKSICLIEGYFDTDDVTEIVDRREEFEEEFYCEWDDFFELLSNKDNSLQILEEFHMTVSDSDIDVICCTEDKDDFINKCYLAYPEIIDECLEGKSIQSMKPEFIGELLEKSSTWYN